MSLSLSSVDMVCIGAKNSQTSPLNFLQPQIVMILASRGFAGSVNPALYSLRETLLRIRRWLRRLEKSNSSESLWQKKVLFYERNIFTSARTHLT